MAKRKSNTSVVVVEPVQPREPKPIPAMPEWWEPPSADVVASTPEHRWRGPQANTMLARMMVDRLRSGHYALPPWQRGDVWSHEQRVSMLETMFLGLPLPPLVMWKPRDRSEVEHIPFGTWPAQQKWGTWIVVDGRQRLTTLMLAADGALDVRWNGREWTSGRGFIDAPTAICGATNRLALDAGRNGYTNAEIDVILNVRERMSCYQITALVFEDYSLDEMVESYRRLATYGTPHSEKDLTEMVEWQRSRTPKE